MAKATASAPGERRLAQVSHVEDRRRVTGFREHKQHGRDRADGEQGDDAGRCVAPALSQDHGEDDRAEHHRAEDEARVVLARGLRVGALGHGHQRRHEDRGSCGEVEPEHVPPAADAHQDAAEDRPEGQGQGRDGRPYPQRPRSRGALRIHVPDDRERPRLAGRRPDSHDRPRRDERVHVRSQRPEQGPGDEHGYPAEHHPLAAKTIAQGARRQHQAGEHQSVPVDHPLQIRHTGVQRRLDVGESDADDRRVEERQEQDGADGGQGTVLAPFDRSRSHAAHRAASTMPLTHARVAVLSVPTPCRRSRKPPRKTNAPGNLRSAGGGLQDDFSRAGAGFVGRAWPYGPWRRSAPSYGCCSRRRSATT